MMARGAFLAIAAACALAAPAEAQRGQIAERVASLRNGVLELRFPSREGICGDGRSYIQWGEHTRFGSWSSDGRQRPCVAGPVRVALSVSNGEVRRAKAYVGPPVPDSFDDVLETSAADASQYLLDLARRDSHRGARGDYVFGAVLGEGVVAWPALLDIARGQRTEGRKGHEAALFWLGRYAAAKTVGSDDPFIEFDDDKDPDEDLKEHAVFVMSQLRGQQGVDDLIKVVRTNRDPRVRANAIFWLGQSGDKRAIDVFEEILRGK
ncbi:MAG TPA: HEAT repeat domain-containing protein [Gemmatimonadaceae bacterium]|nr:HEAT repeat domain-containing protein [Gemmatimonadaceae bacterium]